MRCGRGGLYRLRPHGPGCMPLQGVLGACITHCLLPLPPPYSSDPCMPAPLPSLPSPHPSPSTPRHPGRGGPAGADGGGGSRRRPHAAARGARTAAAAAARAAAGAESSTGWYGCSCRCSGLGAAGGGAWGSEGGGDSCRRHTTGSSRQPWSAAAARVRRAGLCPGAAGVAVGTGAGPVA
jgi:hypothetical protein